MAGHTGIKRHLLFWTAVYLYHVVRLSFLFPAKQLLINPWIILLSSFRWGVISNLIFSYTIIYFLIPKFFQKEICAFATSVLFLFTSIFCLNVLYSLMDTRWHMQLNYSSTSIYIPERQYHTRVRQSTTYLRLIIIP